MKKTKILIVLLAFAGSAFSQNYVYDESFKDTSFARFRVKLLQAILDRDTSQLFPLLAETVHVNDDQCSYAPKECFMNQFRVPGSKSLQIWDDLYAVISFGFSRNQMKQVVYRLAGKGEVVYQAPSYLRSFDDKNAHYLLVLGQNVNIREKPSVNSKVIGQASFERFEYNYPVSGSFKAGSEKADGRQWYEVILPGGKSGYIVEDFVSAGINKELSVKTIGGQWKIISFYNPPPKC